MGHAGNFFLVVSLVARLQALDAKSHVGGRSNSHGNATHPIYGSHVGRAPGFGPDSPPIVCPVRVLMMSGCSGSSYLTGTATKLLKHVGVAGSLVNLGEATKAEEDKNPWYRDMPAAGIENAIVGMSQDLASKGCVGVLKLVPNHVRDHKIVDALKKAGVGNDCQHTALLVRENELERFACMMHDCFAEARKYAWQVSAEGVGSSDQCTSRRFTHRNTPGDVAFEERQMIYVPDPRSFAEHLLKSYGKTFNDLATSVKVGLARSADTVYTYERLTAFSTLPDMLNTSVADWTGLLSKLGVPRSPTLSDQVRDFFLPFVGTRDPKLPLKATYLNYPAIRDALIAANPTKAVEWLDPE